MLKMTKNKLRPFLKSQETQKKTGLKLEICQIMQKLCLVMINSIQDSYANIQEIKSLKLMKKRLICQTNSSCLIQKKGYRHKNVSITSSSHQIQRISIRCRVSRRSITSFRSKRKKNKKINNNSIGTNKTKIITTNNTIKIKTELVNTLFKRIDLTIRHLTIINSTQTYKKGLRGTITTKTILIKIIKRKIPDNNIRLIGKGFIPKKFILKAIIKIKEPWEVRNKLQQIPIIRVIKLQFQIPKTLIKQIIKLIKSWINP